MTDQNTPFEPNQFLDQLIEEMGLQNEAPEKVEVLKEKMAQTLHDRLFEAASEAIEPEVIDAVMDEQDEEKELWTFILELLKRSPAAQEAMTQALEDFRAETLEAFEVLSKTD